MTTQTNISFITEADLCIGCGVCAVSCPHDVISMEWDKNKEYKAIVNKETCTECKVCVSACPMTPQNLGERAHTASKEDVFYGLDKNKSAYIGHQIKEDEYVASSSGGIVSAFAKYLLKTKHVDAVIHAEQTDGDRDSKYFKSSVSYSVEEVDAKRSSFYYPIEFSGTLEEVIANADVQNVLFIGTPCAVSGIHYLKKVNKKVRNKIKYSFSLICGHNVNGQYADILRESIDDKQGTAKLKFRDKEGITQDSAFNNSLLFTDGTKKAKPRFDSSFTLSWRSLSNSLNGCFYCPDFFGEHADAVFKDAWALQIEKKQGETAFSVKNDVLHSILAEMKESGFVDYRPVGLDKFAKSQAVLVRNKTRFSKYRLRKNKIYKPTTSKLHLNIIERFFLFWEFYIKRFISKSSKRHFRLFGSMLPKWFLGITHFFAEKAEKFVLVVQLYKEKGKKSKEVIYTSGYGYRNIGDEAQLSANLNLWKKLAPDYKVTMLSPNPDYTREVHGNYDIIPASRNSFWGLKAFDYAALGSSKWFPLYFKIRYWWIRWNTRFMKCFNRTFLLGTYSTFLLKRLKEADVLHIGGGGYLTGKTQSRLYDNMGLIWVANKLNTDVILSGHNIGIWQNRSHKRIAKQLKKALFIGLRDNKDSIEDLKQIGIEGEKVIPLFDDALLCPALSNDDFVTLSKEHGIVESRKYIAVNCYFSKVTKKQVCDALEHVGNELLALSNEYQILLVPMHEPDVAPLQYLNSLIGGKGKLVKHEDNIPFVISIFQNAYFTLTTRHHPIIFSMAGCTPIVSLTFDPYFKHKNKGATQLFGQDDFVIDGIDCKTILSERIQKIKKSHQSIQLEIEEKLNFYKTQEGLIIKKYLDR